MRTLAPRLVSTTQVRILPAPTDSPSPSRRPRPPSPGERATSQTGAQGVFEPTKTTRRLQPPRAALSTSAHSRSPTGLSQTRAWAGPEPETAAPHTGHAQLRARARRRGLGRASSGPSCHSAPQPPTACPSVLRLGGRPPLPGTHRYQRGRLPAAPPPQTRRYGYGLSPPARRRTKAPPTDRRGHEAMAAGAECGGGGRGRARSGGRGSDVKSVRVYGRAELRRPSPWRRGEVALGRRLGTPTVA